MAFSLDHPALVIITPCRPFLSFHSSARVFAVVAACCAVQATLLQKLKDDRITAQPPTLHPSKNSTLLFSIIFRRPAQLLIKILLLCRLRDPRGRSHSLPLVSPLLSRSFRSRLPFALSCLCAFRAPTRVSPLLFFLVACVVLGVSAPLLLGAYMPFTLPLVSPLLFRSFRFRLPSRSHRCKSFAFFPCRLCRSRLSLCLCSWVPACLSRFHR